MFAKRSESKRQPMSRTDFMLQRRLDAPPLTEKPECERCGESSIALMLYEDGLLLCPFCTGKYKWLEKLVVALNRQGIRD